MNHVKKHPSPDTLAEVHSYESGKEPALPDGYERLTDEELKAWTEEEKARGWTPQRPAPPVLGTIEDRVSELEKWRIETEAKAR